jgi:DNA-binding transcriptional ArsR family regulator
MMDVMENLSPEALEMIAHRFRILSEPFRLRLINLVRDREMSVTELTTALQTSQPNVSKHLKILSDSGIVRRAQRGNAVYYSIADRSIFTLCNVVCDSLGERLKEQSNLFAVA